MKRDFTQTLRITEIFYSIQGESATIGWPTVFVRLTGCPLRCQYCDSAYAFSGGKILSIEQIVNNINDLFNNNNLNFNLDNKYKHIVITGGEPLAQPGCNNLILLLCRLNYQVSIETSGAIAIKNLDPKLMIVMDLKTPDSKEESKNLYSNIEYLKPSDQIKFVICSNNDYLWAKDYVITNNLYAKCEVLFSPSYKQYSLRELADNIVRDRLPVRLQTQLHKHIWGDEPGR